MTLPGRIWAVLRTPQLRLPEELNEPEAPTTLLVNLVLPLCSIRGVAVLVRSLLAGSLLAGIVLSVGNVMLQLGTWIGLGLVLPSLARQFNTELNERRAFALAALTLTPMWLSGVLYVIPETWLLAALWSRVLAGAVALYGVVILYRALIELDVARQVRPALTAAVIVAAVILYLVLFAALGVSSNLVLLLLGTG